MQQVGGDRRNGTGKPEENLGKPKGEADGLSAEPGPGKPQGADGSRPEPGGIPRCGRANTATADEPERHVQVSPPLQGSRAYDVTDGHGMR